MLRNLFFVAVVIWMLWTHVSWKRHQHLAGRWGNHAGDEIYFSGSLPPLTRDNAVPKTGKFNFTTVEQFAGASQSSFLHYTIKEQYR
jgi:hypothetical protein